MSELVKSRWSLWAVAGFILAIASVITIPIPGIPSCCLGLIGMFIGFYALRQIRHSDSLRGKWLSIAAISIGLAPTIWLIFFTTTIILGLITFLTQGQ
jgi:hypothetical protein